MDAMEAAADSLRATQRIKTTTTTRRTKKKKSQVVADVQEFKEIEDSSFNGNKKLESTLLNNFTSDEQNVVNQSEQ